MQSLKNSPLGRTIDIEGYDHRFRERYAVASFVPSHLPDQISLPEQAWQTVASAMADLGRLDAATIMVPNPQLITRPATRREAIGTSALEGTYANLPELLGAEEMAPHTGAAAIPLRVQEVLTYTRAAEQAYEWVAERPITRTLIAALQAELVQGPESDSTDAGKLRTRQVFIGAKHRRIAEARFVPPPPGDILESLFEQWLTWLTDRSLMGRLPILVRAAMAHYQFEAIHPFTDGNGRVGRLLAILQLLWEGELRSPVLSISPWLRDHDDEYRAHLLSVSITGEWAPWVEFFSEAVAAGARDGLSRIVRLVDLREKQVESVKSALPRARLALEITERLIAYPMLSVSSARSRHGRTDQANRNAVQQLVELGILEPMGDVSYGQMYWSPDVFAIIE